MSSKTWIAIPSFPLNPMKKLLPVLLVATMVAPVQARESQAGYSNQCFREVYREEYIPGTMGNRKGRVRSWTEQEEVPCSGTSCPAATRDGQPVTTRTWTTTLVLKVLCLGGLVGAAGGAALSRDEGNFIGIPLGIVGGALVGCQIDGG